MVVAAGDLDFSTSPLLILGVAAAANGEDAMNLEKMLPGCLDSSAVVVVVSAAAIVADDVGKSASSLRPSL